MGRRLSHRGPDGRGMLVAGPLALAHTRLAIVDPHARSAQPMSTADGRFVLAYNGQLHDGGALRGRLTEVNWRTRSDTEVVLEWLARRGADGLADLRGMFALLWWDRDQQAGFLARDALGVKPMVFGRVNPEEVWFASEAKALVSASDTPTTLDPDALTEWVVAPSLSGARTTPFRGIDVLPAGAVMHIAPAGARTRQWAAGWTPRHTDVSVSVEQHASELARALASAVHRTADAPEEVGLFLSGGLDSTAIAAAAPDVSHAWTVRFSGQDRFDYARSSIVSSDDSPFATLAARDLGLAHHWVDVERGGLLDDIAAIAAIDDRLPAWEQQLAQHHLSRAAAAAVRVVLVGDAADETHYGYHFLLDPDVTGRPVGVIERLGARRRSLLLAPHLRDGRDVVADLGDRYRSEAAAAGLSWADADAGVDATTWLIATRWLGRLLHNGDIHTMASGLEARVPFADRRLVALAERVPPAMAFADGAGKQVLRRAVSAAVPDAIRWRRKSALPKDQHTDSVYRAGARRLVDAPPDAVANWLDIETLRSLVDKPQPLDEVERSMLFAALSFAAWARTYGIG